MLHRLACLLAFGLLACAPTGKRGEPRPHDAAAPDEADLAVPGALERRAADQAAWAGLDDQGRRPADARRCRGLAGLVAHGGGAVAVEGVPGGLLSSNSLDALEQAAAAGHDHVEIDLVRTSDDRLVALHDWEDSMRRVFHAAPGVRSHAQWRALASPYGLRHLDLDGLLAWVEVHPHGPCVILDVKRDVPEALERIAARASEDVRARLHPQLHGLADVPRARELGFAEPLLALYAADLADDELLAGLDAGPRPRAVTMPWRRAHRDLLGELFVRRVQVLVHTVDQGLHVTGLLARPGLDGVFSDRLTPRMFEGDPFASAHLTQREREGHPTDMRWLLLDVGPLRGADQAELDPGGEPSRTAEGLDVQVVDLEGRRRTERLDGGEARPLDRVVPEPLPAALGAVASAPAFSILWTQRRSAPALVRTSGAWAHEHVEFEGDAAGLAGLVLTLFNPGDQPARGRVTWAGADGANVLQPVQLEPWRTLTVAIPTHDGHVQAEWRGDGVVIQPLWHDALFVHVR